MTATFAMSRQPLIDCLAYEFGERHVQPASFGDRPALNAGRKHDGSSCHNAITLARWPKYVKGDASTHLPIVGGMLFSFSYEANNVLAPRARRSGCLALRLLTGRIASSRDKPHCKFNLSYEHIYGKISKTVRRRAAEKAHAHAIRSDATRRYRTAVPKRVRCQSKARSLCGYRLRKAPV